MARISEVRKRDNRIVPFDQSKIADAIGRALRSVAQEDGALAEELASAVVHFLEERFEGAIPGIEDIQDLVETVLMEMGHPQVAKAYILYRQKRSLLRETLEVRKDRPHVEGVSYDYAAAEGRLSGETAAVDGGWPETDSAPSECPGEGPGRGPAERGAPLFPAVEEARYGTSSWSKARITAALIRESDLDPSIAEEIASSVEHKVIQSGVRRVSTSLLRELVDNELFERGFNAKLERQQPIGLPKYNLEQVIFGTDFKEGYKFPRTPSTVRDIIANRILHQYSLQEVFSPTVADAHREGRLFVHRLSDPIRCSRLRWEIPPPAGRTENDGVSMSGPAGREPAAQGGSGSEQRGRRDGGMLFGSFDRRAFFPVVGDAGEEAGSYLDLEDFFRRLGHLMHFVSEEFCLTGFSNLLLDPLSRDRAPRDVIWHILDRLSQLSEKPGIVLELSLGDASLPWLEGLVALPPGCSRRLTLSVVLDGFLREGGGALLAQSKAAELTARLYARGDRMEFRGPSSGSPGRQGRLSSGVAGPASGVFSALFSRITLNLPRAAYRSGKDRRSTIEGELDRVIDLAIRGHLERKQFVQCLAQNSDRPLWELLGKQQGRTAPLDLDADVEFTVGVVGLNECVKFLTGRELHQDGVASRKGLALIRHIHQKLQRESRGLGIRLRLEETDNLGPLHALERSDRRLYPEIAEIDRGRPATGATGYTDGVRFHRLAPVDPLRRIEELAPFLPYIRPARGIIGEVPELRSSDRELFLSLLEESVPALLSSQKRISGSGARMYS